MKLVITKPERVSYYIGLDLGQSSDYTALAILERRGDEESAPFLCRHLQRWPLKTPYPSIVSDVVRIVSSPQLAKGDDRTLVIDATGVGAPVVDLFRAQPLKAGLEAVVITGGDKVVRDGRVTRVPKRELVSAVQIALQQGTLKIAPELPDAQTLIRELQNFQVKISVETAHDSYGSWREGSHDDLVLALALALWSGANVTVAEMW